MTYNVFGGTLNLAISMLYLQAILDGNRPFCVFEPVFGGFRATYDDHLRLIGKFIVDFLLVLIELFSQVLMAERAIIISKSAISLQRGPVDKI